jgi:DNA polymerase (family 10)
MVNKELAAVFEQIADLLEIQGQDPFRINSYRRAARTIGDLVDDVAEIAKAGKLLEIDGVGKGTAERINEYLRTGKITVHQELLSQVPAGLPALLEIPNLGPKKAAAMWKQLGVTDAAGLQRVIDSGELAKLKGFGAKSVQIIAEGMRFLQRAGERTPLGVVMPIAELLLEQVQALPGVKQAAIAGSLRRGCETIGDVDLLCEATNGKKTIAAFCKFDQVKEVLAHGSTKGSVRLEGDLQVDLRVVPAASYGAALQYFTGNKEHNIRLRERAIKKKRKLNEYGLFVGEKQLAGKTEESIYKKLGVIMAPPEMREDRGELDLDATPRLIELKDIRGDLHMHTVASDGVNTVEELAEACRERGYEYLGITEHSRSSTIANGLSIERMLKHVDHVRAVAQKIKGLRVLISTEVDILADGRLDYPDRVLETCDIVTASIHSGLRQKREQITGRFLRAMENPHVHIIGHVTGRLLGQRPPSDVDIERIVRAAAETGTALELNAAWQRLDLCDLHVRLAIEGGAMLVIGTDAHAIDQLDQMRYGVITARRGWAEPKHVLNTRGVQEVLNFAKAKRQRKKR